MLVECVFFFPQVDPEAAKWVVPQNHNAQKALLTKLNHHAAAPPLYQAEAPMWDKHTNASVRGFLYFLLPFEVLDCVIPGGCVPEWCHLPDGSALQARFDNWARKLGITDKSNFAKLGVWGDAAPYTKRGSVYLLLFSVLCGTQHMRYWIIVFTKDVTCQCGCYGRHTFETAWSVMNWALQHMLTGIRPAVRHDGVAFQDSSLIGDRWRFKRQQECPQLRCKACCLQFRGDWAWHKQALGLCGWKGEGNDKRVCWKCGANLTDCPFTDASLQAKFRQTISTTTGFLLVANYLAGVWAWPGFDLDFVDADFTHCACVGIVGPCLGNILYELFLEMNGVLARPGQQIAELLRLIKFASKQLKMEPPLNDLTFTMIKQDGKSPRLRAKAAESLQMVPVALYILGMFPIETPHQQLRVKCLQALHDVYVHMVQWGPESRTLIGTRMRQHVILYSELSKEAVAKIGPTEQWLFWRMHPKHHLILHVCEDQVYTIGNPRETWAYGDEHQIGRASDIAGTLHPRTVSRVLMQQYRASDFSQLGERPTVTCLE